MRLGELIYRFRYACRRFLPQRQLQIYPEGGRPRGRALVSYLPLPIIGDPALFRGHSNVWESAEIVRTFNRLGYVVDLISWDDVTFQPREEYDVVFDIHRNLLRCSSERTKTIFHVTGSNPEFSNRAEAARLAELKARRDVTLEPRRRVNPDDLQMFAANLARADLITLIGNEVTETTFPTAVRTKMRRVIATGSWLPPEMADAPLMPRAEEFLWFNGVGGVHKGLDVVLELFARHPELTLHVVGPYLKERDFVAAYRSELFHLPNVRSHGFLFTTDRRFLEIASRAKAFISPSCSEGISTAAITCMQAGVVPIISENCGISLHELGIPLLKMCTLAEIEEAVLAIVGEGAATWREKATVVRRFAWKNYSRRRFSQLMEEAIASLLLSDRVPR